MFIQTEATPNPLTMKFIPGMSIMAQGTVFYTAPEQAKASPLAQVLFAIGDVKAVFFGNDFITITKSEKSHWEALKPIVLTALMDHLVAGKPVMSTTASAAASQDDDSDIAKQIRELIDTRVRPAVAADGGDIIFRRFRDGIVELELHGACSGCPSSTITLKNGIENMLKHYVPEVIAVEAVA